MNIEELKDCFDCVTPTKEQKDRMFKAVMNAKNQPVKIVKFNKARYFSAVAAVVVIGVFAVLYSNISGIDKGLYVSEVAVEYSNTNVEKTEETPKSNQEIGKDNNLTSQIKETYAKVNSEGNKVDTKVAVVNEFENNDNIMTVSEDNTGVILTIDEQNEQIEDKKEYDLIDIRENIVYSAMFPERLAEGFEFINAFENPDGLETFFETIDGRSMSIKFMKKDLYEPYQQIIIPEQTLIIPNDGYMEFALDCGEYYTMYYVETDNAEDVYNMVKSTPYYK